jgi:predicted signal transduction protein with EAL and GGDEF domain
MGSFSESLIGRHAFPEGRRQVCVHIVVAIDKAIRVRRRVAVMIVGLDERYGDDPRSDEAQAALFQWQAQTATDTHWTRIGVTRFAVVVASIGVSSEALAMGEELLDIIDTRIRPQVGGGSSSASIGISLFPEDGDDAGLLLAQAEAALQEVQRPPSSHRVGLSVDRAQR